VAVEENSSKSVVHCSVWHWARIVGVHRVSLGCVLLSAVCVNITCWDGVK